MDGKLAQIDTVLAHIERLAEQLQSDPDGHVRRSANELRAVFKARGAIEPAVARVRDSVHVLRRSNQDGSRCEVSATIAWVDHLEHVVEQELLPNLRRVGFDV